MSNPRWISKENTDKALQAFKVFQTAVEGDSKDKSHHHAIMQQAADAIQQLQESKEESTSANFSKQIQTAQRAIQAALINGADSNQKKKFTNKHLDFAVLAEPLIEFFYDIENIRTEKLIAEAIARQTAKANPEDEDKLSALIRQNEAASTQQARDYHNLLDRHTTLICETDLLKEQMQALQEAKNKEADAANAVRKESLDLQQSYEELQEQLKIFETDVETLEAANQTLLAKNEAVLAEKEAVEKQNSLLQNELQTQQQYITDQTNLIANRQKELSQLENHLSERLAEIEEREQALADAGNALEAEVEEQEEAAVAEAQAEKVVQEKARVLSSYSISVSGFGPSYQIVPPKFVIPAEADLPLNKARVLPSHSVLVSGIGSAQIVSPGLVARASSPKFVIPAEAKAELPLSAAPPANQAVIHPNNNWSKWALAFIGTATLSVLATLSYIGTLALFASNPITLALGIGSGAAAALTGLKAYHNKNVPIIDLISFDKKEEEHANEPEQNEEEEHESDLDSAASPKHIASGAFVLGVPQGGGVGLASVESNISNDDIIPAGTLRVHTGELGEEANSDNDASPCHLRIVKSSRQSGVIIEPTTASDASPVQSSSPRLNLLTIDSSSAPKGTAALMSRTNSPLNRALKERKEAEIAALLQQQQQLHSPKSSASPSK